MKPQKPIYIVFFLMFATSLIAQNKHLDNKTRLLTDSLDKRIIQLHLKINNFGGNRDAGYFYAKRELDMTVFLREYEELVFDEDLLHAQSLIESRIKVSKKRSDKFAIDYYLSYKSDLTKLRGKKRAHYQKLFEKEKTFIKEYKKYIKPADEFAYKKTLRMLNLAKKHAIEMGSLDIVNFLTYYENYTHALLLDLHSNYDLQKITSSESAFLKVFEPLVETDSLEVLQEVQVLLDLCYDFATNALTQLDTNYFSAQKIVLANAMADWNERQGISTELSSLTSQSIVARRDSLNKEGIYQWNDLIIVIGSVNFDSKSENVRKGEAIIDADKTIINYIRINKIARVNNSVNLGRTSVLPIDDNNKVSYFRYDTNKQAWQYMVAYTSVINSKITNEISKFLPPLQFQDYISEIEIPE